MNKLTIGFLAEVTLFILSGYFLRGMKLFISLIFLILGGAMAYIVGKGLINEGKNSINTTQ